VVDDHEGHNVVVLLPRRIIVMMYHGWTVPRPRHLWHVNSTPPLLLPLHQELELCDIVLAGGMIGIIIENEIINYSLRKI
jgi:hypothetical protein